MDNGEAGWVENRLKETNKQQEVTVRVSALGAWVSKVLGQRLASHLLHELRNSCWVPQLWMVPWLSCCWGQASRPPPGLGRVAEQARPACFLLSSRLI